MMKNNKNALLSRREFVTIGLSSTAGLMLAACIVDNGEGITQLNYPTATPQATPIQLELTPQCDDHDETPAQTAGPFYAPNTPERTNLRTTDISGTPLLVTGKVLTTDCRPVAGAILDFWHCDAAGNYDNEGYLLRGHQFTDGQGSFQLETIVLGLYLGRTRHIHVRVQGPDIALLTTQLYFPDEPTNAQDDIYNPVLLMDIADNGEGQRGVFNFVLS